MTSISTAYSKIRIETPENISIEYELAGPGSRMTAYLVDFILLIAGISAIAWFLTFLSTVSGFFDNEQQSRKIDADLFFGKATKRTQK